MCNIRRWFYSIRLYMCPVSAHIQYINVTTHPTLNLNIHYILFFRSIVYIADTGRVFCFFIPYRFRTYLQQIHLWWSNQYIDIAQATEENTSLITRAEVSWNRDIEFNVLLHTSLKPCVKIDCNHCGEFPLFFYHDRMRVMCMLYCVCKFIYTNTVDFMRLLLVSKIIRRYRK